MRPFSILLFLFWAFIATPPLSGQTVISRQIPAPRTFLLAIDAGHGGEDTGACSADSSLVEKELVLDLSQKLLQAFGKEPNFQVILLREGDIQTPVFARAEKANKAHAQALISLHAASDANRNASGIRIFLCNPDGNKTAPDQADRESALALTLWEEAYLPYQDLSNDLALQLQNEMRSLYLNSPEIRPLPLLLLRCSAMPSVLVEVGNLADPLDAEQLKKEDFRLRLVQSIKSACLRFHSENP